MRPPRRHGTEAQGHEDDPADQEPTIERDRRVVVELHAAVDPEPGFVQPAEAGRVDPHQHVIDPRVEPARRPIPEEEAVD